MLLLYLYRFFRPVKQYSNRGTYENPFTLSSGGTLSAGTSRRKSDHQWGYETEFRLADLGICLKINLFHPGGTDMCVDLRGA